MVRFVGFFRLAFSGALNGEVGAENGCGSESESVDIGSVVAPAVATLSDKFLTFLALLPGDSGRIVSCDGCLGFKRHSPSACSGGAV